LTANRQPPNNQIDADGSSPLECGGLTPLSFAVAWHRAPRDSFISFRKGDCCSDDWHRTDVASSRDEKKRRQAAALQTHATGV